MYFERNTKVIISEFGVRSSRIILGSVIWALYKIGLLASLSTKFDLLCHEGDWHVVLESHGVFVLHVSV